MVLEVHCPTPNARKQPPNHARNHTPTEAEPEYQFDDNLLMPIILHENEDHHQRTQAILTPSNGLANGLVGPISTQ